MSFLLLSNSFLISNAKEQKMLIPAGESIGVTLETNGVLVSALSSVPLNNGLEKTPALDAGLKSGDIITSVDNKKIKSVPELIEIINNSSGKSLKIAFLRNNEEHSSSITPALSFDSKKYCIGVWVKDAVSGIGTLTFYDKDNMQFAALGHGILSPESGELIPISSGKIIKADITSAEKGKKGIPGELKGTFKEDENILGTVSDNKQSGLFGKISSDIYDETPLPIASKEEIKKGKALVYSTVSSDGTKSYEIEILRVLKNNFENGKDMVIKITDKDLINKTGGIIQGMSGSPIIQNGKLVGAITHVFVNDPTKGYGIFIENMLSEAEKIK